MSKTIPCDKCEHPCAYDASSCPNCGSGNPFDFPSRLNLCLTGAGGLFLAYVLKDIEADWGSKFVGYLVLISLLSFIIAFFRDNILLLAAKFRKNIGNK